MRISPLLVILSLVGVAHASPEGVCKKEDLVAMRKAVAKIDAEIRPVLVLRGLTEACESALPAGMAKAIYATQEVDPADRGMIIAALLTEQLPFATAACPDFTKVFPEVAKVAPAEKAAMLYRGCKYGSLGLASEKEFVEAAKTGMAMVLIAPPYFKWLVSNKMDKDAARRWMRDVLGLK